VWEWTASQHEDYRWARVLRGGAFWTEVGACGVGARGGYLAGDSHYDLGFRCCVVAQQE